LNSLGLPRVIPAPTSAVIGHTSADRNVHKITPSSQPDAIPCPVRVQWKAKYEETKPPTTPITNPINNADKIQTHPALSGKPEEFFVILELLSVMRVSLLNNTDPESILAHNCKNRAFLENPKDFKEPGFESMLLTLRESLDTFNEIGAPGYNTVLEEWLGNLKGL
jgi:hypothetical protein